jgi:hypothetical protein
METRGQRIDKERELHALEVIAAALSLDLLREAKAEADNLPHGDDEKSRRCAEGIARAERQLGIR